MTKVFKLVLVGAMLAGLMAASLGGAQADTIKGTGPTMLDFEWTIDPVAVPGVNAPSLTYRLNGEEKKIGGENVVPGSTVGGVLRVVYSATDWEATFSTPACPAGQQGLTANLAGTSPTAKLQATFTPYGGTPQDLAPPATLNGLNPDATYTHCVGIKI